MKDTSLVNSLIKAAELGNVEAQYILGLVYVNKWTG